MLLQTNSYIVPKDKRAEHARVLRRFRASLAKLGCDSFEVYEQVGSNWSTGEPTGRYVQIMRFRDRRHQLAVQAAERNDPSAQAIIAEFCQLINFPYQQQQGLFAVGFYNSVLPVAPSRPQPGQVEGAAAAGTGEVAQDAAVAGPDAGAAEAVEHLPAAGEHATGPAPEPEVATEVEVDSAMQSEGEAPAGGVEDAGVVVAEDDGDKELVDAERVGNGEAVPDENEAPSTADDVDDPGALLDAHVQSESPVEPSADAELPVAEAEGETDDGAAGLDALDLDELDLPDDPTNEPDRAPKHVAH